jgi:hypothetical protein
MLGRTYVRRVQGLGDTSSPTTSYGDRVWSGIANANAPRHGLAPSLVAGIQPACAVARPATSRSCAPCAPTRRTLFPIVSVESASIDSDTSLPCDRLGTLAVNEVCSVGNSAAARAHGHGLGSRALANFLFLFFDDWLQVRPVLIRTGVRRGRRQITFFHRCSRPIELTGITRIPKQVRENLPFFK